MHFERFRWHVVGVRVAVAVLILVAIIGMLCGTDFEK
jgi:hypothetical protein